jgi:antitoxin ParD1/3/4
VTYVLTRKFAVAISRRKDVPTRNVSLTTEQDAFVKKLVEAGEYRNASEAIRYAIRALQRQRRDDALKLKALRTAIRAGVDALEQGYFREVADLALDEYLEGLAVPSAKGSR